MSVYARRNYDDGQVLFNRTLFAFATTLKFILKIIAYSPLLCISYLLANKLLGAKPDIIALLVLVLVFSTILYYIIYFFKGIMIALKCNRKLLWIPLYIFCVTLTCILPVWIVFDIIDAFFSRHAESNQQLLTWICTFAFGLYVYGKYHFLTNIAPVKAFPYYQRGIILANYWCNLINGVKARKSREYM